GSERCDARACHGCDSSLGCAGVPERCADGAVRVGRATRAAESTLPAAYRCEAGWRVPWRPACLSFSSVPCAAWLPAHLPAWGGDRPSPSHPLSNCSVRWLRQRLPSLEGVALETRGKAADHAVPGAHRRRALFHSPRQTPKTFCARRIR